jgi:hypothetical protein
VQDTPVTLAQRLPGPPAPLQRRTPVPHLQCQMHALFEGVYRGPEGVHWSPIAGRCAGLMVSGVDTATLSMLAQAAAQGFSMQNNTCRVCKRRAHPGCAP